VQRINSDLANDLGNLVSRTLTMAAKFCDGRVPHSDPSGDEDRALRDLVVRVVSEVEKGFEDLAFHKTLIAVWELINAMNRYIVESQPWVLAKDPDRKERLNGVIYHLLEALRVVAVLTSPFMPGASQRIMAQLGIEDASSQDFASLRRWGGLAEGSELKSSGALFPRVEYRKEEKVETAKAASAPFKDEIDYADFEKVDLRVATVLEAEAVPKSNKLIKMKIDVGEERTIVAGIAKDYKPEELVGKKIVVVVNLKPTKLMGVESRGMLLATDTAEGLTILSFDREPKPGANIR
jgi:methionyl-tRNA synthetase